MGDRVELGRLVYNVFDTQWLTHLGDMPGGRVPNKRFLLVRTSIVNSGGQIATVPTFELVDDRGQTYSELSDGTSVPSWVGFLREIPPADALQGNVVFDVDPAHYKLRIGDEAGERLALVNLPLKFEADNPALSSPLPQAEPELQIQSPGTPTKPQ